VDVGAEKKYLRAFRRVLRGSTHSGSDWRWRRRARWVGCGRDCASEEVDRMRLLGTGMVVASGGMDEEGGMVGGGGLVVGPKRLAETAGRQPRARWK
jgi:hypothetical protein